MFFFKKIHKFIWNFPTKILEININIFHSQINKQKKYYL